jgi:hypothetical protein
MLNGGIPVDDPAVAFMHPFAGNGNKPTNLPGVYADRTLAGIVGSLDVSLEDAIRLAVRSLIANPDAVHATQNGWFKDEFEKLGFFRDEKGIYHALLDAWHKGVGYNPFYDLVFHYATSMKKLIFGFSYNDQDYRFWAWKGDYLNLGAGAELGIYVKSGWKINGKEVDHWLVDTSLALPMTMTLRYTDGTHIASYTPQEPQWWITSFNPYHQGVNANDLIASFTVDFSSNIGMFDAFYKQWGGDSPWIFDHSTHKAILIH